MELKERCIYYNAVKGFYYLTLSISDMVYGRTGNIAKPSMLDNWMYQDGHLGLCFKIDDIIINGSHIRNYYLGEEALNDFELVRELTKEEFNLIEIFCNSKYTFPGELIDVNKCTKRLNSVVSWVRHKKAELAELENEVSMLENRLFRLTQED